MNERHPGETAPRLAGSAGGDDRHNPTLAPLLVDRRGAARLLGVSGGTIDNLRLRGELQSLKLGARRLYAVADLHALVEKRKAGSCE